MGVTERDAALRAALFARLGDLTAGDEKATVRSADVNRLQFEGRPFQVIGQTGIRKVAGLEAALSFTTVYRREGAARPYQDDIGPDGLLRYKYRGTDPSHPDNRALRRAIARTSRVLRRCRPWRVVVWPVYLVAENPLRRTGRQSGNRLAGRVRDRRCGATAPGPPALYLDGPRFILYVPLVPSV